MDSVRRDGDDGVVCRAGDAVGVDGPRKEAKRLMRSQWKQTMRYSKYSRALSPQHGTKTKEQNSSERRRSTRIDTKWRTKVFYYKAWSSWIVCIAACTRHAKSAGTQYCQSFEGILVSIHHYCYSHITYRNEIEIN